jgi:hypothetical protein
MKPPISRKYSTDITDGGTLARPCSPAPTYCSKFHEDLKRTPIEQKSDFEPLEEPFDTHHPHYIPPAPRLPPPITSRPTKHTRLLPPLRLLIPWTLALIFFLTTLWYTSILAGARFLNILNQDPYRTQPINIVINSFDATPSVKSGTYSTPDLITTSFAPASSATLRPLPTGNGFDPDPGTNTVTGKPAIAITSTQRTGFVTVTRRDI